MARRYDEVRLKVAKVERDEAVNFDDELKTMTAVVELGAHAQWHDAAGITGVTVTAALQALAPYVSELLMADGVATPIGEHARHIDSRRLDRRRRQQSATVRANRKGDRA